MRITNPPAPQFGPHVIAQALVAAGNVGAGATDIASLTLKAGSLSGPGNGFWFRAWGVCANNANAKSIVLADGTLSADPITPTVSVNINWSAEIFALRNQANQHLALARLSSRNTATQTLDKYVEHVEVIGLNELIDELIKVTATGVANNDIICSGAVLFAF